MTLVNRALRRRVQSFLLIAIAVGAGLGGYLYAQNGSTVPKYRLAKVERGPIVSAVSATGNLNAVTTVQVGSQVSGQIKELFVDFNSAVRKGQVIAKLNPDAFESKVNQARAELDSARAAVLTQQAQVERSRADLENARSALAEGKAQTARAQVVVVDAKRDLDRKTELARRQLISTSEHDSAQALHDGAAAQLDAARAKEQSLVAAIGSADAQLRVAEAMLQASRASVKQKEAVLAQALVDLGHTTIRAPVDGIVISRQVDVGQTVAASLSAPVLFTIAQDLTRMQVETSVDEADIGRVPVDGRATFTVDAFPGETFTGRIVQVRKAAQILQNVVTYTVVVAVDNPERRLVPGMTANVKLLIAEKRAVVKVPSAALRFRPPGAGGATGSADASPRSDQIGVSSGSPEKNSEELVRRLGLTAEQKAKVDRILEERRQAREAVKSAGLAKDDRKARRQAIKETTRARIRETLTPEQRAKYDQLVSGDGPGGVAGRVWVVGEGGRLQSVALMLGITDGGATEVLSGDLKEGQDVVIGLDSQAGGSTKGGPRLRL